MCFCCTAWVTEGLLVGSNGLQPGCGLQCWASDCMVWDIERVGFLPGWGLMMAWFPGAWLGRPTAWRFQPGGASEVWLPAAWLCGTADAAGLGFVPAAVQ